MSGPHPTRPIPKGAIGSGGAAFLRRGTQRRERPFLAPALAMNRYAVPIFLGAFLLFQIQPIVARAALPWFGGSPSVWTTCLLFFQILLLVGYAAAHLVVARLRPGTQGRVQLIALAVPVGLLVFMMLVYGRPALPPQEWKPQGGELPAWHIVWVLGLSIGVPYLLLATTSPLLQAWFSHTHPGRSPYRLYALSNVGSLLALITYPFLIEPNLKLTTQAGIWTAAYVVFAGAHAYCALHMAALKPPPSTESPEEAPTAETEPQPLGWCRPVLWLVLPALASIMLLAVTNHLCVDVAAVPFLWILPLSLYLLSFIICFDNEKWYFRFALVPILLATGVMMLTMRQESQWMGLRPQIAIHGAFLFLCCMVCHGELVALKPQPRHLTAFYLAVAAGGALGGVLVGLVAPRIFSGYTELPLGITACVLVAAGALLYYRRTWPWWAWPVFLAAPVVTLLVLVFTGSFSLQPDRTVIHRARSFYGVMRVALVYPDDPSLARHLFLHGTTTHGYQYLLMPENSRLITSYYAPYSGIGLAFRHHGRRGDEEDGPPIRIGITGLGSGSLMAWARPQDYVRFYEIDPEVIRIAQDPQYFTYLSGFEGTVDVVLGDARISLERELRQGSQGFDIMVLDAFTSDAVPTHLLTREAFEIYLGHLRRPHGIIAVNIANRVLDLVPVIRSLAADLGLECVQIEAGGDGERYYGTNWALVTYDRDWVAVPEVAEAAVQFHGPPEVPMWTDDYSNLFRILR